MLAFLNRQDIVLYCATWTLMLASLVMIISIGGPIVIQQVVSVILALALMIFCAHINWRTLSSRPIVIGAIYLVSLLILALTSLFAPVIRNTRSWLVIGPVQFQVAELMKVALIIILAYYFARHHIGIAKLSNIARSFFYYLLPAIFIFLQPDMGTMIVLTGIWIGFLLVSGLRPKHILIGLGVGILLVIIAWFFVFAPYQKERIIGFFQPDYDPLGVNYSTIQAKIAIGSGGFFGKGFRQGTQTQLGFLPEPETDFIFAALSESGDYLVQ
ncbi:MAG: FtsW/RodA/SpoVE family cell cycle protein [Candidatus Paceibacterota bacterium]